jgi:hypothetical protein
VSSDSLKRIKQEILRALSHDEAEEGLYFSNLYHLHEEDERPAVEGSEDEIAAAISSLLAEGRILQEDAQGEAIYRLSR